MSDRDQARAERTRIEEVYGRYRADPDYDARHAGDIPGNARNEADRWVDVAAVLAAAGRPSLAGATVVEVGAGTGGNAAPLIALGADPDRLLLVDLLLDRLRLARDGAPGHPVQADGTALPLPSGRADVVVLSTVLSSVLDAQVRALIAAEAVRALGPGGAVLCYDLRVGNPRNPNLVAITRWELRRLFPGLDLHVRSSTVAPPLARRLRGPLLRLWPALRALPAVRTHWTAVLVAPAEP